MKNIKNKKKLLEYLDHLIYRDKKFNMPEFSKIAKKSKFFNSEYKKLLYVVNKKNKTFLDEISFDEVILKTYFSSSKIRKKISLSNQKLYMKFYNTNFQKPTFRKQKSIYKDINFLTHVK